MRRLLFVLVLCLCALGAHAQQPTTLPQPDLDLWRAGSAVAMAATADGGRIVGGDFQAVGGLPRRHLARLLPDGSVDPAWSVVVDGPVHALAVDSDGRIYLGGAFANIGGAPRNRLARLSASGQIDAGWNPSPADPQSAGVYSLLITGGSLYVAGHFTSMGGLPRSHLARFATATGAIDPVWAPAASTFSGIRVLAADAQFLYFTSTDLAEFPLARAPLAGNSTIDAGWAPQINNGVQAMLADGAGSLYIAGSFNIVQGSSRPGLARLSTNTGAALDPNWNPAVDGYANALALDGSGLYVGGLVRAIAGQPRANLARVGLTGSGSPDPAFAPTLEGGAVSSLLLGAGGVLHVGGEFTAAAGQPSSALASVTVASGVPLPGTAFAERSSGSVEVLLQLPDGSILAGGRFTRAGALPRSNLLRLTPQGVPDPAWQRDFIGQPVPYLQQPGELGGFDFYPRVSALARDASGRIYVGGVFSRAGSVQRANLARLLPDGQVDADWNPGTDGLVNAIAPDNAGNVFVGGNFHHIAGQARGSLAKLGDGPGAVLDPIWQANLDASAWVVDLKLDGAGSLFVGGNGFQSVNGNACCVNLVKLSASGSGARDALWNVRPTGSQRIIIDLLLDGQDSLYIAGRFDGIDQGGNLHNRIGLARVSSTGAGFVDEAWTPLLPAPSIGVTELALGSEDRLYAAPFGSSGAFVGAWSTLGSGAAIDGWQIAADSGVRHLHVSGGTLYVAGEFGGINGQPRRGLAAFATEGLFRDSFE